MNDRSGNAAMASADPAQMASWSETLARKRRALNARIRVEASAPCPDARLIQRMCVERARLGAALSRLPAPDAARCA